MKIDTLPTTYNDIKSMSVEELVRTVKAMANPHTEVSFEARMATNTFLSLAALILAEKVDKYLNI